MKGDLWSGNLHLEKQFISICIWSFMILLLLLLRDFWNSGLLLCKYCDHVVILKRCWGLAGVQKQSDQHVILIPYQIHYQFYHHYLFFIIYYKRTLDSNLKRLCQNCIGFENLWKQCTNSHLTATDTQMFTFLYAFSLFSFNI